MAHGRLKATVAISYISAGKTATTKAGIRLLSSTKH
jgi:hypothetical protein